MFDFASLNLGKVDTLVDVGAGVGAFLGPALEFYKPSKYLAIEMLPERVDYLRSRFSDRSIWWGAVGEKHVSAAPILRTVSADSASLLTIDPKAQDWFTVGPHAMDQFPSGAATIWTLDEIMESVGLTQIDLMKMDVQGYEGRAIRGGQETLKRTRALIIEVLHCHHYEGQSTPGEIYQLLTGLGLNFVRWLTDDWNADRTIYLQGDALYVNTRF